MTLFLNTQSLSKSFGTKVLFKGLSLSIFSGERLALIGPNGSGKSTLLKILSGREAPSSGSLSIKKGLKIGFVPQTEVFPDKSVENILKESLEHGADHEKELLVATWMSKLQFTGKEAHGRDLSGGWKKRLSLALALMASPDLLLLDEPTNHLDLESVLWLEKFLQREVPSYLIVSHDRSFLENMATRIIEINPVFPEGLFSVAGSYSFFLEKKEEFLLGQIERERSLASKARYELEWLRSSPKARTTKSKARVEDAEELLQDLAATRKRNEIKKAGIGFVGTERETHKLLVLKNIAKKMGEKLLFSHLDITLSPGTRIGLMGPNGSGKTSLLRIIAGHLSPDMGTIKQVEGLKIVYFDQHREALPLDLSLKEALSPKGDFVEFQGRMVHVSSWAKKFLFSPDLLGMPIRALSGGERARIAIAHLMLQPADILLLDEPTNDLDIETLETLEESLLEFQGAIVLITHDRALMERVCNGFLAIGSGNENTLYAEYSQWEMAARKKEISVAASTAEKKSSPSPAIKISYAEKKEYEQMENTIASLEKELQELQQGLGEVSGEKLRALCQKIQEIEERIEAKYRRFEELEKKILSRDLAS